MTEETGFGEKGSCRGRKDQTGSEEGEGREGKFEGDRTATMEQLPLHNPQIGRAHV